MPVVSKTSPRRRAVSSRSTVSVVACVRGDSAAPSSIRQECHRGAVSSARRYAAIHQEVSLRFRRLDPSSPATPSCVVSRVPAVAVASYRVDHCCAIAPAVLLHVPPSSPVVVTNAAQSSSVSYVVAVASYRVDHCSASAPAVLLHGPSSSPMMVMHAAQSSSTSP